MVEGIHAALIENFCIVAEDLPCDVAHIIAVSVRGGVRGIEKLLGGEKQCLVVIAQLKNIIGGGVTQLCCGSGAYYRACLPTDTFFAVTALTEKFCRLNKTFLIARVSAACVVCEPAVKVGIVASGEHVRGKVIVQGILEQTLHEKSRADLVRIFLLFLHERIVRKCLY